MTSLPFDISRCVGRFGLGPDDPICPRRDQCVRYLAIKTDRERWPNGYPPYVPVATGLCRDGDDLCIEGDADRIDLRNFLPSDVTRAP